MILDNFDFGDACFATSPVQTAVTTTEEPTTEEPIILRACSPTGIPLGRGDTSTPQLAIDVTYRDYVATRIGDTLDTTSTMVVTCSAIQGYFADMHFDNGYSPTEGLGKPRTISVNLSCSSVDMKWMYEVTLNGIVYRREVTEVNCDQYSL